MCRWLGYFGSPIETQKLLYDPEHSLIEQSRRAEPTKPTANGDGFGMGWYTPAGRPVLFRSESPAWGDDNLYEISAAIESPLFLAHVRAATGARIQQTNCHPFRYGRWMFVHNGFIGEFTRMRRELLLAVRPDLFDNIAGTTDSEVMFHLALTYGLDDDPIGALERMAGHIEALGAENDVAEPLQMTIGLTDGERLIAVRYASGPEVNTLYASEDLETLRMLYPQVEQFAGLSEDARVIVSEPLLELPGMWHEIQPSTALIVQKGPDEERPFRPQPPS
jgi:predicted glutamine amidotransferase